MLRLILLLDFSFSFSFIGGNVRVCVFLFKRFAWIYVLNKICGCVVICHMSDSLFKRY